MKRIFCIIIALIISSIVICSTTIEANGSSEFTLYNIPLASNECSNENINGYYSDNEEWFFNLQDLCEMTRTSYKVNQSEITLSQGALKITIDSDKDMLRIGDDETKFEVKKYDGNYIVKPYALLKLLCADCVCVDNSKMVVTMPAVTTYEAIKLQDMQKLYRNIYNENRLNFVVRMASSIFIDCFFSGIGELYNTTSEKYLERALFEINKVDVTKSAEQEYIDECREKSKANYDIVCNLFSATETFVEPLKKTIMDLELKGSYEILNHLKSAEDTSKFGKKLLGLSNIIISTEDKLSCDKDSYTIFSKTLTEDNLKNIPGDYSTLIKSANKVSEELESEFNAIYSSTLDEIEKNVIDEVMKAAVDSIDEILVKKNNLTAADDLYLSNKASTMYAAYGIATSITSIILHNSIEAYAADLNAIYLSAIQNDICYIVLNMDDDMDGFWNPDSAVQLVDMLNLYDRTSIALYTNLIKSNSKFGIGYDNDEMELLSTLAGNWAYALSTCEPQKDICTLNEFKEYYKNDTTVSLDLEKVEMYSGQATNITETTITTISSSKNESELKSIIESKGNICAWEYADYDGNGTKEAFAIIGSDTMPDFYVSDYVEVVYYISSNGDIKEITNISGAMCSKAKRIEHMGKSFFSYDATAGASGSEMFLFGVKNNNCYELKISGSITDFFSKNGTCYATLSEFLPEGGHVWNDYELEYDENEQEFYIINSVITDNQILNFVNAYLENNQSDLGVLLSNTYPYCASEYMASSDTKWSCPINNYEYTYSPLEYIAGSYPYYAFVDKKTMICTITANYDTVAEFDLSGYING